MGRAKDELYEVQERAAVAEALNIEPSALEGFGYELLHDTDRDGNVIRSYIRWDDELPDGISTDGLDDNETTVILSDRSDGPEDDEDRT